MPRVIRCWIHVLSAFAAVGFSAASADNTPFAIDDYFKLRRVAELALSSDGEMMAYAVAHQSLNDNKTVRAVYVSAAALDAEPERVEEIQDARGLAWISGKPELAFLSDRDGVAQVFSYDAAPKSVRRHTDSNHPIVQFRFAPDGALAYITRESADAPSLYRQFQTGEQGLVIDPDVLRVQHFTDPNWDGGSPPPGRLWIVADDGLAPVDLPGGVDDVHWSFDSTRLAVTYASSEPSTSLFARYCTSLGVYNIASGQLRVLAEGVFARSDAPGMAYDSDAWLGANRLIVRRAKIADIFVSPRHPQWTIIDASMDDPLAEEGIVWRELSLTDLDRPPLFHTFQDGRAAINKTIRGDYRSLYVVSRSGELERSDFAKDIAGNISMVRFSVDGERAVFVHDSLSEPPEIHLWQRREGFVPLTTLNRDIAKRRLPVVRSVEWKSKDGAQVRGWLLLPDASAGAPFPLITFVHGGPSLPMPAGFAESFSFWPYPFEAYAAHGMAVFFANYRGNTTFGRAFADPDRQDGEPVDDIIAGIEHLIRKGIADPARLAISGHSHGAWLAPMVMTRYKDFQAGSFADGWGNNVTVYEMTPGRLNRELHDDLFGASLYSDPKRYFRLSPVLHFEGLRTAALFEAGNQSLAITMMSYPKGAQYAGMPAEFIIYPQTGHNPTLPRIQKESAMRNLDWFRFWLQGYKDPDPEKEEQYKRWRKMRQQQCERVKGDESPSYCRQ